MQKWTRKNPLDITILGAGIQWASNFHAACKYTKQDLSVLLLERKSWAGLLNSNETQNSQTLHIWDIESNYDMEKSAHTYNKSQPLKKFAENQSAQWNTFYSVWPQMLVWVWNKEIDIVTKRYDSLKELWIYENLSFVPQDKMGHLEPELMRWRDIKKNPIVWIRNEEWVRIDFGKAAQAYVKQWLKHGKENAEVRYNRSVKDIQRRSTTGDLFEIFLDDGTSVFTKSLIMSMGSYTEVRNNKLWYNTNKWIISMAANYYRIRPDFFTSPLMAKIYGVQKEWVPYAKAHLDWEWNNSNNVRVWPTALPTYFLEKDKTWSMIDFLKMMRPADIPTFINLLKDPKYAAHMYNNLLYKLPYYGPKRFLDKEVRSYLPQIQLEHLEKDIVDAWLRAIWTDRTTHTTTFWWWKEYWINLNWNHENIISNAAASPWASVAWYEGPHDINYIAEHHSWLDFEIDHALMKKDWINL